MQRRSKICAPTNTLQKKIKKIAYKYVSCNKHLKIYEPYISTLIMRINAFQNVFMHIYTSVNTFICIYMVCTKIIHFVMQRNTFTRFWSKHQHCHNATIVKMPLLFITKIKNKSVPLHCKTYHFGTNRVNAGQEI